MRNNFNLKLQREQTQYPDASLSFTDKLGSYGDNFMSAGLASARHFSTGNCGRHRQTARIAIDQ